MITTGSATKSISIFQYYYKECAFHLISFLCITHINCQLSFIILLFLHTFVHIINALLLYIKFIIYYIAYIIFTSNSMAYPYCYVPRKYVYYWEHYIIIYLMFFFYGQTVSALSELLKSSGDIGKDADFWKN